MLATALLAALVAVVLSAPQQGAAAIPIVKSTYDDKGDGTYSFS